MAERERPGVYRLVVCIDVEADNLTEAYRKVCRDMEGLDWESSDEAFDPDGGVVAPDDLQKARMKVFEGRQQKS